MSEEKPRLSRRELRERGLLAPITDGTSPLQERSRNRESAGFRSSRRADVTPDVNEVDSTEQEIEVRESEENRRSVFDRFVSDDDEAAAEVLEDRVVSGTVATVTPDGASDEESLEERLLTRVRENGLANEADASDDPAAIGNAGTVSLADEARTVGVDDAVVDAEIIETEYDLDELAEPKRHSFLMILIFILVGLVIGLFIGVGIKSLGASLDGEIQPKFSVDVLQTVDSLQEENSVSI